MEAKVDGLGMLCHTIEVRFKLKLKELGVVHELVLAIAFELLEALFDLIKGYEDVLASALLLDQDISAEGLIFVFCCCLMLVCVYSDEGVLAPDQAAYLVLSVVV